MALEILPEDLSVREMAPVEVSAAPVSNQSLFERLKNPLLRASMATVVGVSSFLMSQHVGLSVLEKTSVGAEAQPPNEGGPRLNDSNRFVVFPVDVHAEGFDPVQKTDEQMASAVSQAWVSLSKASGGFLSPDVDVKVEANIGLILPSIASLATLCKPKEEDLNFRDMLTNTVLAGYELEGATPVVVIDQKDSPCAAANAGPNAGIVVFDEDYIEPLTMQHEIGHVLGLGHSNLLDCRKPYELISLNCKSNEYGDWFSVMGRTRSLEDLDPLTGIALRQIGAIPPSDVLELSAGQSQVDLQALRNGSGIRLVHIPVEPTQVRQANQEGEIRSDATTTISDIYIELSGSYVGGKVSPQPVSLKIYGTNHNEVMSWTHLLPFTNLTPSRLGQRQSFEIGNRKIGITMQSISFTSPNATGSTQLVVEVEKLP